jgi:DNA-binding transcriptional MerR regulator
MIMGEPNNIDDIRSPIYNIKAVSRFTGLRPVTLRAWERRYGLPEPTRGEHGHRLYSEYDVRVLNWLKRQIDAGMNIGRAVDYLLELKDTGRDPALQSTSQQDTQPLSLDRLRENLMQHLIALDENGAKETLRRAFSIYAVDDVLTHVVQAVLVDLGEAWHRGELPVAVEHYASQFFIQHLMSMMSSTASVSHSGIIVAAAAPGEFHHIGLLILVVMLRWRGWDTRYLGPNLELDLLDQAVETIRPKALLFSATRSASAHALLRLPEVLERLPEPKPLLIFGGQAFQSPEFVGTLPGLLISGTPVEIVNEIERLMIQRTRK